MNFLAQTTENSISSLAAGTNFGYWAFTNIFVRVTPG